MKSYRFVSTALAFAAAIVVAAPAFAQMYKWVDQNGATHYSDRKPDDPKAANKLQSVDTATVSVYSPDKTLLRAVEVAREKASQPPLAEPERIARPYIAPVAPPPPPAQGDPCEYADCGGYYYPAGPVHGNRRHGRNVKQVVLPAGATAGTVNSPGIIPGNTGTTPTGTAGHPAPQKQFSGARSRPPQSRPGFDQRFR